MFERKQQRQPGRGRRYDVLRLAREGLSHKQIAAELGVSLHAVKYHIAKVYRERRLYGIGDRIKFLMGIEAVERHTSLDG